MVNFAAGARTQMAMLIAAGLLALAVIFFSPLFENIPKRRWLRSFWSPLFLW